MPPNMDARSGGWFTGGLAIEMFHPDMPPARNTDRERDLALAYCRRKQAEDVAEMLGLEP